MKQTLEQATISEFKTVPRALKILCITLIIIGVFFRCFYIDAKVYWDDEVYTSLRISGYTEADAIQQVFNGSIVQAQDLQQYQYPNDNGIEDTVRSLMVEDSQHPPLYFVLARFWLQIFGHSTTVIRSFSIVMSLLALPCLYWLAIELCGSSLVAWIATALLAVSPYYVLFAPMAREYSMWSVVVLLSSVAFLRAVRSHTKQAWIIYAISIAVSLYTFTLSGFVAIAHGIYLAIQEKGRWSKTITAYLTALAIGIATFIPWLVVITHYSSQVQQASQWSAISPTYGRLGLILPTLRNATRIFLDFEFAFNYNPEDLSSQFPYIIAILAIATLIIYALYCLWRQSPPSIWAFVFSLIFTSAVFLFASDVLLGGQRSLILRYLLPSYLGILLAVAFLFATKMTDISDRTRRHWRIILVSLWLGSILSCANSANADAWWHNGGNKVQFHRSIAQRINQSTAPLVISDARVDNVIALSHLLRPDVALQLTSTCYTCTLDANTQPPLKLSFSPTFKDYFAFRPSESLQQRLLQAKDVTVTPILDDWLWKLERS